MKKERLKRLGKICTNLFPHLLLIIIVLFISGCGKNNFNKKVFTETVEKNNFVAVDIEEKEYIETIAVSSHYQLSLFSYNKSKEVDKAFKDKIKYYKNKKANIKHKKNYFYIENKNVYTINYKINNYIIEAEVPKTYKEEVIKILKEMKLKL